MPGSGLLHLKRQGTGRAEQGMRAAVGGVRRRGEAEVPADREEMQFRAGRGGERVMRGRLARQWQSQNSRSRKRGEGGRRAK